MLLNIMNFLQGGDEGGFGLIAVSHMSEILLGASSKYISHTAWLSQEHLLTPDVTGHLNKFAKTTMLSYVSILLMSTVYGRH